MFGMQKMSYSEDTLLPNTRAILLISLGTPDALSPKSVRSFLQELFLDECLVPLSWMNRYIVAYTASFCHMNESMRRYKAIWLEEGSPLLVHSTSLASGLQKELQDSAQVFLAMRYGTPSLDSCLKQIELRHFDELCILPCFPIHAPPITSSILKALTPIRNWSHMPKISFLPEFCTHRWFVKASANKLIEQHPEEHDHVVFSFHALPEEHASYVDRCISLAADISKEAKIQNSSVAFQSKMGRGRWSGPTTSETLEKLLSQGKKRILVSTPGFIVDCVETIWEVGMKYQDDFLQKGGECLTRAACLNDSPLLIEGIKSIL